VPKGKKAGLACLVKVLPNNKDFANIVKVVDLDTKLDTLLESNKGLYQDDRRNQSVGWLGPKCLTEKSGWEGRFNPLPSCLWALSYISHL